MIEDRYTELSRMIEDRYAKLSRKSREFNEKLVKLLKAMIDSYNYTLNPKLIINITTKHYNLYEYYICIP